MINALLPPAISAAAEGGGEWPPLCRAPTHGGKSDPATAPRHCVLCLAAVIGTGPLPQPAVLVPPQREESRLLQPEAADAPRRVAHHAALPRGPPGVA